MLTIIFCIIAYLIGSISTAIFVSRLQGLPDPREVGSGNPGATNILRQGKTLTAVLVLVLDALKGWLPVSLAIALGVPVTGWAWVGLAAFLGHLFPVYFNFQGGKGVATGLGVMLGIAWPIAVVLGILWITVALAFHYSSLASIAAAIGAPLIFAWFGYGYSFFIIPLLIMSILLLWRHKGNIQRLMNGEEDKIKLFKSRE